LFHFDCKCRVNHNGCDLEVQPKGAIVKIRKLLKSN
jgi:hypothetical protein